MLIDCLTSCNFPEGLYSLADVKGSEALVTGAAGRKGLMSVIVIHLTHTHTYIYINIYR